MRRNSLVLSVFALVLGGFLVAGRAELSVTAQEATPAAMTAEETRITIEAYLDALLSDGDFGQYLAEDVALEVRDTGQVVEGRQAVVDTIVALHQQIFEAQPELSSLVVGEGTAAAELVFAGTHTGEFAGIPATGRAVRVPYAAFYDLAGGQITAIRLFGFASGLVLQLTAEATPTTTAGSGLVGTWRVVVTNPNGSSFSVLSSFMADGTTIHTGPISQPAASGSPNAVVFQSAGNGVWEENGPETSALTFELLTSDERGTVLGRLTVAGVQTLSPDGNSLTGQYVITITDPTGKTVAEFPTTATGERMRLVVPAPLG
jgi:predicted ester cyclase